MGTKSAMHKEKAETLETLLDTLGSSLSSFRTEIGNIRNEKHRCSRDLKSFRSAKEKIEYLKNPFEVVFTKEVERVNEATVYDYWEFELKALEQKRVGSRNKDEAYLVVPSENSLRKIVDGFDESRPTNVWIVRKSDDDVHRIFDKVFKPAGKLSLRKPSKGKIRKKKERFLKDLLNEVGAHIEKFCQYEYTVSYNIKRADLELKKEKDGKRVYGARNDERELEEWEKQMSEIEPRIKELTVKIETALDVPTQKVRQHSMTGSYYTNERFDGIYAEECMTVLQFLNTYITCLKELRNKNAGFTIINTNREVSDTLSEFEKLLEGRGKGIRKQIWNRINQKDTAPLEKLMEYTGLVERLLKESKWERRADVLYKTLSTIKNVEHRPEWAGGLESINSTIQELAGIDFEGLSVQVRNSALDENKEKWVLKEGKKGRGAVTINLIGLEDVADAYTQLRETYNTKDENGLVAKNTLLHYTKDDELYKSLSKFRNDLTKFGSALREKIRTMQTALEVLQPLGESVAQLEEIAKDNEMISGCAHLMEPLFKECSFLDVYELTSTKKTEKD